jgi:hypothetical protein
LQGYTSAYYKFGLMQKEELVAVATFSKSRIMHDGPVYYRSYELERYASKLQTTVNGGLGKLLHHFIEQYHPAHVMTYAHRDWSEGLSYQKLGFHLAGYTSPQRFQVDTQTFDRFSKTENASLLTLYNAGSSKWILDRRPA